MKRTFVLWAFAVLCPLGLIAQSFTYNYKGVDFKCKKKDGKIVIRGFDTDVAKVIIPSQVTDKRGNTMQVVAVDLFAEFVDYNANVVVVETGITEIKEYCFLGFKELADIYIPNSVERIGKKAFNAKYAPTFHMPSSIQESDLLAGNVVVPQILSNGAVDPLVGDFSDYGMTNDNNKNEDVVVTVPKVEGITPGTSDIDYNIPTATTSRKNTFCVIIANETYKQKDTPDVKYASQDGKTFNTYCLRTLGLPRENVRFVPNASYLQTKSILEWFRQIGEVYGKDANFIFYYAGHGVPDEKGNCKLIPADVSINDVNNGFSLKELYDFLGEITTRSVLVLIDACFSGNDREDVAAVDDLHRGIVREVKAEDVTGDVVVLTAASNTETALSYDEKAHGLFSYYLMKKLQETKGDVTYGELYDYIKKEVMRKSIVVKGKKQTPSVTCSNKIINNWKDIKF